MFINNETGICSVYLLDSSMDVGPAVSLLRYAKGDGGLPNYAPDFFTSTIKSEPHRGTAFPMLLGAKFTDRSWP